MLAIVILVKSTLMMIVSKRRVIAWTWALCRVGIRVKRGVCSRV